MLSTIKNLCEIQGLTLKELEDKCEMSNGSISKWDKNAPSVVKIVRIAELLGVPVTYLIRDDFPEYRKALGEETGINSNFFSLSDNQKLFVNSVIDLLLGDLSKD